MYSVYICLCKHAQSAVCHVKSSLKICSILKKGKGRDAYHIMISYKEIKQTKTLLIRKIFVLVVMQ